MQLRLHGGAVPPAPFQPFHCLGLGVVPKQDGTWRVITHLSAPDGLSINDYIDPESITLSYTTVDDAVGISQRLGRGWGKHWSRKRLLIHCDNQAMVHVWHTSTTKHRSLMALVRALFFIAASQNFTVLLQHIPGQCLVPWSASVKCSLLDKRS